MARPRTTVGKLQRDQAKREKARAKAEDRLARRAERGNSNEDDGPGDQEDQEALLAEFARLHEDLADGRISLDEFESRQEDLRRRLRVD
jgi:ATP-dependent helicase/DNAse subunit B